MTDPLAVLEKYKGFVWKEIEPYLSDPTYPKSFVPPKRYRELVDRHWRIVREYPERKGKYLRPVLVILTGLTMGAPLKKLIKTAAAMQVSEDWLLIHDDWEDGSIQRRGAPTLHLKYGAEQAINAGDTLHAIMWKILRDNEKILGTKTTFQILDEFYVMLIRTSLGQAIEITWTKDSKKRLDDDDWFFVADGKTSYYTIAHPMRLGGFIARATLAQINALTNFGKYLGRCFQLVDDILDVTGDFSGLKEKGNDIYEGKRTLLLNHLVRSVRGKDKIELRRIMEKPGRSKSKADVKWVIDKIEKYGSIERAKEIAKKLNMEAKKIFERDLGFLSNEPARSELKALVEFVLERKH